MTSDPSPVVRRTAAPLSAMMEEHMSESLDLVGPAERVIALRGVPLFSSLEPADLHRIAGSASERAYPEGTCLFSEGEAGTDMCVVLDGSLEVTRQTDAGLETFNSYGPGDHVGELAVLRHAPRTADVTAATDVRVLVIEGSTVDSILVERPEVARTMLATLADRLAVLSQQALPSGS
jgi:CRP-like cAMP-binding protein